MSWLIIWRQWQSSVNQWWPVSRLSTWLTIGLLLVIAEVGWLSFFSAGENSASSQTLSSSVIILGVLACLNWGFWRGLTQINRASSAYPALTTINYWQRVINSLFLPVLISLLVILPIYLGFLATGWSSAQYWLAVGLALTLFTGAIAVTLFGLVLASFGRLVVTNLVWKIILITGLVWSSSQLVTNSPIGPSVNQQLLRVGNSSAQLLVSLVIIVSLMTMLVISLELLRQFLPGRSPKTTDYLALLTHQQFTASFEAGPSLYLTEIIRLVRSQAVLSVGLLVLIILAASQWLLPSTPKWEVTVAALSITLINLELSFSAGHRAARVQQNFRFLPAKPLTVSTAIYFGSLTVSAIWATIVLWIMQIATTNSLGVMPLIWLVLISHSIYFVFGLWSTHHSYRPVAIVANLIAVAFTAG
jgi:hypothetical protein